MVAGIETAGLVLAAFPIIINCLKKYAEGVKTIKDWRDYGRELADYARKLRVQQVFYQNTTERLIEGIVQPGEDLATMLADPSSPIWQNAEYDRRLRIRLHSVNAFESYMDTAETVRHNLDILKDKLGLDSTGQVCHLPSLCVSMFIACET